MLAARRAAPRITDGAGAGAGAGGRARPRRASSAARRGPRARERGLAALGARAPAVGRRPHRREHSARDRPRRAAHADRLGSADEATEDCGAGAKRLRRLLTHFARTAPPDQGYCQGLNFLGSTLLRVFDADRDPRATTVDARGALAFRGLVALVAPLYAPDFRGLRELVAVAGAVLPAYAPRLAALLRDELCGNQAVRLS